MPQQAPTDNRIRTNVAIEAAADALLAVCALQTGLDPDRAIARAMAAITAVYRRAEQEQQQ
jgi:hypothetical protein